MKPREGDGWALNPAKGRKPGPHPSLRARVKRIKELGRITAAVPQHVWNSIKNQANAKHYKKHRSRWL